MDSGRYYHVFSIHGTRDRKCVGWTGHSLVGIEFCTCRTTLAGSCAAYSRAAQTPLGHHPGATLDSGLVGECPKLHLIHCHCRTWGLRLGDFWLPPTNTSKTSDRHHCFGPAAAAVRCSLAKHPEESSTHLPVKTCCISCRDDCPTAIANTTRSE